MSRSDATDAQKRQATQERGSQGSEVRGHRDESMLAILPRCSSHPQLETIALFYTGDAVVAQFPFVAGETVGTAFATHLQPLLQGLGLV